MGGGDGWWVTIVMCLVEWLDETMRWRSSHRPQTILPDEGVANEQSHMTGYDKLIDWLIDW